MRIAFVADSYPPDLGGIEVVVSELARRIARTGHEVEVFTHSSRLAPAGTYLQDGVLVRRYAVPVPSREFSVSPAMFTALRRKRRDFDVFHAHNFHASPALLAALAGVRPLVFTPHYHGGGHSLAARLMHLVYRPVSRLLFRSCDRIVCVSEAEARAMVGRHRSISAPISVVPNGVVASAFAEAEPFDMGVDIVVAAGRIESYKQFEKVALAAASLPQDMRVVLLGEGSARRAVEECISHENLDERVQVLGYVSNGDLHRWFRTARVLVTMSRHEAFGLTVLEALAAGTSVVASDIPAHREIAENQPPDAVRLISPNATPREIAEAVICACRERLPSGIRLASWDDVASQMAHIYELVALGIRTSRT